MRPATKFPPWVLQSGRRIRSERMTVCHIRATWNPHTRNLTSFVQIPQRKGQVARIEVPSCAYLGCGVGADSACWSWRSQIRQDGDMARYDFRCRTCDSMFEVERPMAQSNEPAPCPDGHTDTVKLLSRISVLAGATPGRVGGGAGSPSPAPMGGGCGGGCACAH